MSPSAVPRRIPQLKIETGLALPWYAIRTRSNHERIVATGLQARGYEPYLPTYRRRRHWSDRIVETDQPLFPGYLFCRFDGKKQFPIVTTPGVASIVGFGDEPARIEDHEIEAVQGILSSGLLSEPHPFLREGQRVLIRRGPLRDLEGILLKKKSDLRLVVSVSMLQRSVSVELEPAWLAA